jgi:hypothetical protein
MENKPKSPLAAISLMVMFLLPMAVFVGVVLACKYMLAKYIPHQDLRTAISFVIAAVITLAVLYAIKMINQRGM